MFVHTEREPTAVAAAITAVLASTSGASSTTQPQWSVTRGGGDGGITFVHGGRTSGKSSLLAALQRHLAPDSTVRLLAATASAVDAGDAGHVRESSAWLPDSPLSWEQFARTILLRHGGQLGGRLATQVLHHAEHDRLVRSLVEESSSRAPAGEDSKGERLDAFVSELAGFLACCQREGISAACLREAIGEGAPPSWESAARVLESYRSRAASLGGVGAWDLLPAALELVRSDAGVQASLRMETDILLVDDGHRLRRPEWELIELLCDRGTQVVVALDDHAVMTPLVRQTLHAVRGSRGAATLTLGGGVAQEPRELLVGSEVEGVARPEAVGVEGRSDGAPVLQVAAVDGPVETARVIADLVASAARDGVALSDVGVLLLDEQVRPHLEWELRRDGVAWQPQGEEQHTALAFHLTTFLEIARRVGRRLRDGELSSREALAQVPESERFQQSLREVSSSALTMLLASSLVGLGEHGVRRLQRSALVARIPFAQVLVFQPPALPLSDRRRLRLLSARLQRAAECFATQGPPHGLWSVIASFPAIRRVLASVAAGSDEARRELRGVRGVLIASESQETEHARASESVAAAWGSENAVRLLVSGDPAPTRIDVLIVSGCTEGTLPRGESREQFLEGWRLHGLEGEEALERLRLAQDREYFEALLRMPRVRGVFLAPRGRGEALPSRFLLELGDHAQSYLPEGERPRGHQEVVAGMRRTLRDPDAPVPERLAAATVLAEMAGSEMAGSEVQPRRWWYQRRWTKLAEPLAPGGALRSSYSRIAAYEECHLRYFYASVAGLDDGQSYQMAFGKLMHVVFELAAKGVIDNTPQALSAAFKEHFDPEWFSSRPVAVQYWRDGLDMLRRWHAGEADRARAALAFEVGFAFPLGRHVLRGRIDRVDKEGDGVVLLDYKTSRWAATQREVDKHLQLAIYNLAALRDPGLARLGPPVELQLVYPALDDGGRFKRVRHRPRPDAVREAEGRVLALLDGAAAERFEPNPSADCRYCAFKPLCPRWPEGAEVGSAVAVPLHAQQQVAATDHLTAGGSRSGSTLAPTCGDASVSADRPSDPVPPVPCATAPQFAALTPVQAPQ